MGGSAFHRLMARLADDPVRAEEEFHRLRRALTKFFDWRGASQPDDDADETLARLAAKLEEGVEVLDIGGFAHGIARMVLMEDARAAARRVPLETQVMAAAPPASLEDDALARRLEQCLEGLAVADRELVLSYYDGDRGAAKIDRRRRLAQDHALSSNALRSRVQRLRDRLEECVRLKDEPPSTRFGTRRHRE